MTMKNESIKTQKVIYELLTVAMVSFSFNRAHYLDTPSVKIPFELEITRFNSLPSLNCIEYEPEPSNGENY